VDQVKIRSQVYSFDKGGSLPDYPLTLVSGQWESVKYPARRLLQDQQKMTNL
jgi:hypothetical protein